MAQIDNTMIINNYNLGVYVLANLTECEDLNISEVNDSCVNLTNEYRAKVFYISDTHYLLSSIYYKFIYTVSPLGLLMNILNIVAIANAPSALTPHSRFVISLALSDLCIILPTLGQKLMNQLYYFERAFNFKVYLCYNVAIYSYFEPCVILVSLLNLLALGVDHFIAIVKPLHYTRIVSNSRTKTTIALIWAVSFITVVLETVPEIINYCTTEDKGITFCKHMNDEYVSRIPYLLVIPVFMTLIILYTRIFIAYRRFVTRRQLFRPDDQHNNKAIVTTLLIIGTFMFGWVPYCLIEILQMFFFGKTIHFSGEALEYVWFISIMCKAFIMLNSLCDALIYALRLAVVKEGYKAIFRKCCGKCKFRLRKNRNITTTEVITDRVNTVSNHNTF